MKNSNSFHPLVAVLTGGGDKPYALGISAALGEAGISFDCIGSDELEVPELLTNRYGRFFNLRGSQDPTASAIGKLFRVLRYYLRLFGYVCSSRAPVFHILWHNKFEWIDRTLVLVFYRLLGKRIVFTAHNVNTQARDGRDSALNRFTLRVQYRLVDHIFVHTRKMKDEIVSAFTVPEGKISVIPFGINATNPCTDLTRDEARERVGLKPTDKALLFFGNIAEYKGLDILLDAFASFSRLEPDSRLVIAGRPKCSSDHWREIENRIASAPDATRIIKRMELIPDDEVEIYFKAADVLILPYREIFQSGVLFLGYNFGLPVLAADVGSLKDDIVIGETGFVFKPSNVEDLSQALARYFKSDLYTDLAGHRPKIRAYAHERFSWSRVMEITSSVYSRLTEGRPAQRNKEPSMTVPVDRTIASTK